MVSENAEELIFWQPVQWQAQVIIGGFVTRIVTRPHRHAPVCGREGVAIKNLLR